MIRVILFYIVLCRTDETFNCAVRVFFIVFAFTLRRRFAEDGLASHDLTHHFEQFLSYLS